MPCTRGRASGAEDCGRGSTWSAGFVTTLSPWPRYAMAFPPTRGRGMDRLPRGVTAPLEAALVRTLDAAELRRAFGAATAGLLAEIQHADPRLAERLGAPFLELTNPAPEG